MNSGVPLQPIQAEATMGRTPDETTAQRQFDQFANSGNGVS